MCVNIFTSNINVIVVYVLYIMFLERSFIIDFCWCYIDSVFICCSYVRSWFCCSCLLYFDSEKKTMNKNSTVRKKRLMCCAICCERIVMCNNNVLHGCWFGDTEKFIQKNYSYMSMYGTVTWTHPIRRISVSKKSVK